MTYISDNKLFYYEATFRAYGWCASRSVMKDKEQYKKPWVAGIFEVPDVAGCPTDLIMEFNTKSEAMRWVEVTVRLAGQK